MLIQGGYNVPIYYGPEFHHLAEPSRPIEGTITDGAHRPTPRRRGPAGVFSGRGTIVEAKSGGDGRFRFVGLATDGKLRVEARPGKGQPYLRESVERPLRSSEEAPVRVDLAMVRGVLVRGRVIDGATKRASTPGSPTCRTARIPTPPGGPGSSATTPTTTSSPTARSRWSHCPAPASWRPAPGRGVTSRRGPTGGATPPAPAACSRPRIAARCEPRTTTQSPGSIRSWGGRAPSRPRARAGPHDPRQAGSPTAGPLTGSRRSA